MAISLSLRPKITLGTLLILFACMVLAGSFFLQREQLRLQSALEREGQTLATLVAKFCATPIEKFTYYIVQEVARSIEDTPGVAFCEIYNSNGDSLVLVDTTIHGKALVKKSRQTDSEVLVIVKEITKDGNSLGRVEIGLEISPIKTKITNYTYGFMASVLIILTVVAASLYVFLSRNFISPVINLSEAAKNLARGDFVETEDANRNDEIGHLAQSFNEMSKNLEQLYLDLERKVNERTADLIKTNDILEKEILVRQKTETELKEAKDAAEQANMYKSNFVAHMSHEIRTPLNAIIGYAQILLSKNGFNQQDRKALKAIDKSGSHLLGIINDILDLSKIEAGRVELKPNHFDLCLLLRNITSMFQLRCTEKSLTWQVVGLDISQVIPVYGDSGKLRQILINLLGNAVKFTDRGGVVLRIIISNQNNYRFCVEDTGIGIPDSAKDQILDPFNQMSGRNGKEGTGLGLSICQSFLVMLDSNLEVLNNTPHGSRFCFNLVLPPGKLLSPLATSQPQAITKLVTDHKLTTLIVDDDKLSRSMLAYLLNKADIDTIEAVNGVDAMKVLQKKSPDIIFLDRYMPEMDGVETIKTIQKQFGSSAPPIVMITAAAFESENLSVKEMGIAGILFKPIEIHQVLKCLSTTLNLETVTEEPVPELSQTPGEIELNSTELYIPEELRIKLQQAAEFGRVSELKTLLHLLKNDASVNTTLVDTIEGYLEKYQLDNILDILTSTSK
ncbi:response regulator [Desulforhopalus sp. 52FAK]